MKEARRKLPRFAVYYSREMIGAVIVGVLVTLISTAIIDRFFYAEAIATSNAAPTPRGAGPATTTDAVAGRRHELRSRLAQVLALITSAKMVVSEYYMHHGSFPRGAEELDLGFLDLAEHELIDAAWVTPDGGVGVNLAAIFGSGRRLVLSPTASTHGAFISWRCTSNVEPEILGFGTGAVCEHSSEL